MKYTTLLAASLAATSTALVIARPQQQQAVLASSVADEEKYLVEFGPGDTRWVTEDDKWALKRVCSPLPSQSHF